MHPLWMGLADGQEHGLEYAKTAATGACTDKMQLHAVCLGTLGQSCSYDHIVDAGKGAGVDQRSDTGSARPLVQTQTCFGGGAVVAHVHIIDPGVDTRLEHLRGAQPEGAGRLHHKFKIAHQPAQALVRSVVQIERDKITASPQGCGNGFAACAVAPSQAELDGGVGIEIRAPRLVRSDRLPPPAICAQTQAVRFWCVASRRPARHPGPPCRPCPSPPSPCRRNHPCRHPSRPPCRAWQRRWIRGFHPPLGG